MRKDKGIGRESRKNKSSGGTREIGSLEEHSGYARSDMNVGDQDQGPRGRGGGAKSKAEGGAGRGVSGAETGVFEVE